MPQVNVPGVGTVNFPDDMPPEEIQRAIETEILPKSQQSSSAPEQAPAPAGPSGATKDLETYALDAASEFAKSAGMTGYAVTEGLTRVAEGMGEVVSTVAQAPFSAYDAVRSPNVSELVTGKQPTANILGRYREAVENRRGEARAEFERTFRSAAPEGAATAAELGFGMVTGATELKAAKTFLQVVKNGAKVGAITSGTYYSGAEDVSDKLANTLVGTALGGTLSAAPGAVVGSKNILRRYLTSNPVPEASQAAQRAQAAFPSLKGELTLGQEGGNVRTIATESKVAQRVAQEQWLRQQSALTKDLQDIARRYGPDLPPEELVKRGGQAIANQSQKLKLTRNAIWKSDLEAIRTKLAADAAAAGRPVADGGKALVELPGLQQRVADVLSEFRVGETNLAPRIQSILESHGTNRGAIAFDDLDYLLQAANDRNFAVLSGTANAEAQAVAARKIRGAINASLDDIGGNSEVGQLLQQARQTYGAQSQAIKEINTSAAAKILGVDKNGYQKLVQNPELASRQILNLTPSQQRETMALLKSADPELVSALKRLNLQQALVDAIETTAAGTTSLNVQKLIQDTTGGGKLRAAGLYSPGEADVLKGNLEALNSLMNRAGYKSNVVEPVEATRTLFGFLSGAVSTPFLGGMVAKATQGQTLEKVLFNPAARKEFLLLKDEWGKKSAASAAAIARLGAMMEGKLSDDE